MLQVDTWHGIPVALTGEGGQGKTSVGLVAASAYGPPRMFKFDAANATNNAPDPFFGLMYNLPVILDEYTGKDPKVVANQLYGMSTGRGKMRMDQRGKLSEVIYSWDLIPLITGNMNINESMSALHHQVTEAGQVRVFEYVFTNNDAVKPFAGTDVKALLEAELPKNYGLVGRHFIRYIMNHASEIRNWFYDLRAKYGSHTYGAESKERFFVDLIATAEIGGKIFKQLGYIHFDVDAVIQWALQHMVSLRQTRRDSAYSLEDQAARFIQSLHGSVLCTKTYGAIGTTEIPSDMYPIRTGVQARLCTEDHRFLVSFTAFREWCKQNNVQGRTMLEDMIAAGYVRRPIGSELERVYLTRGTVHTGVRQRALEFNYDLLQPARISDTEQRLGTVSHISEARK